MTPPHLRNAFRAAGQSQVFAFWDSLNAAQRESLLAQTSEVNLGEIARLHRSLVLNSVGAGVEFASLRPPACERLPEHGGDAAAWSRAKAAGEAMLSAGRVAAFTVAGGQGSRLGFDGPKGTFGVTPVKRKSLFQVFAEKIATAGRRYTRPLHWFIMTSHANHEQTEAFFSERAFFGLDRARVHFFRQGRMPAVDHAGKILMEAKDSLALSPDGHGGSLRALHRSGALDLLESEGVDTISYFQVDNPLVRCIDPAFLGFHALRGSEMSSKMVPKAYPEEKVGMFCQHADRLVVVEYSDLPMAMQRETNAAGSLRFEASNIAVHLLDREFVRRVAAGAADAATALPFHRADKKIPAIDALGRLVTPEKPNGVKFEMFVFDALPFARNPLLIETRRADDFSPVKNAEGADSPQSSRDDQLRQAARWLRAAGEVLPTDPTGLPTIAVEVSPLFADDAESFSAAWKALAAKPPLADGLYLD